MKKIILVFALALLIVSCKKETKEKVEEATEAVGSDMKQNVDTAKVKMDTAIDTAKSKVKKVIGIGAEKVEETAKDIKESVKK